MKYVTQCDDRCPACGHAARIVYQVQENGAGVVKVKVPYRVRCTNRLCQHASVRG